MMIIHPRNAFGSALLSIGRLALTVALAASVPARADVIISMPPPVSPAPLAPATSPPETAVEEDVIGSARENADDAVITTSAGSERIAPRGRTNAERVQRIKELRSILDRPEVGQVALSQYTYGRTYSDYTYGGYFRHYRNYSHHGFFWGHFDPFWHGFGWFSPFHFHFGSSGHGKPHSPKPPSGHHHSAPSGHNH